MLSYVYILMHSPTKKFYIGQRKSKTLEIKDDFLKKYFTSSDVVKTLMKTSSVEFWSYKILQTHKTYDEALEKENIILRSIPKSKRLKYLNKNFSAHGAPRCAISHKRITNVETKETIYWPKELDIPDGWKLGSNIKPPSRKGFKTYIHPYTLDKISSKERPDEYLTQEEWTEIQCFYPKLLINTWVTNGIECKRVSEYQSKKYISEGWRLGKTANWTKSIKVTNGLVNLYIESLTDAPEGFTRGSCVTNKPTLGKSVYNNGVSHAYFDESEQIPNGYIKGPISNAMKNKIKVFDTLKNMSYFIDKSLFDASVHVIYNRATHDLDRLAIVEEFKINGMQLPKFWKNYSKAKLSTILRDKLDDTNRVSIAT